jgi:hypothetical protein
MRVYIAQLFAFAGMIAGRVIEWLDVAKDARQAGQAFVDSVGLGPPRQWPRAPKRPREPLTANETAKAARNSSPVGQGDTDPEDGAGRRSAAASIDLASDPKATDVFPHLAEGRMPTKPAAPPVRVVRETPF